VIVHDLLTLRAMLQDEEDALLIWCYTSGQPSFIMHAKCARLNMIKELPSTFYLMRAGKDLIEDAIATHYIESDQGLHRCASCHKELSWQHNRDNCTVMYMGTGHANVHS
jgi:hypothetical protein